MTFSTRTWPANGGTAGSVVTSYGPRSTSSQYGGVLQDGVKKTLTLEFTAPSTGMAAAAWAKNGGVEGGGVFAQHGSAVALRVDRDEQRL